MTPKTVTIKAIIEASSTGFGVYATDEKLPISGYGKTVAEAKKDMEDALADMLAYFKEKNEPIPEIYNDGNLEFVYQYDMASIFNHFGMLDATNLAKRIGINPSLMRQYKQGLAALGEKQKKKIEAGLHQLGRELLEVKL